MNKNLVIRTIDPLNVAEKLEAVRNFLLPEISAEIEAEPRLVEALWFLQWVSMPENFAGGLARFATDLVARYADQVGPEALLERKGTKFTSESIETILESFPFDARKEISAESGDVVLMHVLDNDLVPPSESEKSVQNARSEAALSKCDFAALHARAVSSARDQLADFLHRVCTSAVCRFGGQPEASWEKNRIWYFPRLWKCIFAWMDEHAARTREAIAETSITKEISRWLDLAQESGKGVMFIGHSRFGKSRAVRSFAGMYPGRVRIVECPSSTGDGDLLREVARALGIRFDRVTIPPLPEQRAAIDSVIRQAKFLLIFDEAQFLFPQAGNKRAVPQRLNYVRRAIMDAGVPTAFICTHQNWRNVEKNFLKVSAYSMEQFEGRLLRPPIHLTDELTESEMIEVARVHLPELDNDYLKFIVLQMRPLKGGDHLSSIENIAIIARSYARERGEPCPVLADLERGINDVLECYNAPGSAPDELAAPAEMESRVSSPRKNSPAPARSSRSIRPAGFDAAPPLRSAAGAVV